MMWRILILVVFAELLSAQSGTLPCCRCEGSGQAADVVCLDAKEMRDRVDHLEPLKPSGLEKGLNLSGIVIVEVRFDSVGKTACARAKSGHPIAISAALTAIKKWTFKPIVSGGVAKGGCGAITIKYRLRDQGSSTALR